MEQPPIARKDISTMKEAAEKKKRKRIANILPQQQKAAAAKKRKSGRPSTQETLTRIANDEIDTDKISFYVLWMDQKRKRKQF
jgi:rhamnose utilization protein RhaD (predicted bifunctional aldolase and dehydrogenase)